MITDATDTEHLLGADGTKAALSSAEKHLVKAAKRQEGSCPAVRPLRTQWGSDRLLSEAQP